MPKQQLVLAFDGTACSFPETTNVEVIWKSLAFGLTHSQEDINEANGTVTRHFDLPDGSKRIAIYQEGLGTPKLVRETRKVGWGFSPQQLGHKFLDLLNLLPEAAEQLDAFGIIDNIKHAYRFLAQNYCPGDDVFVFGFSRGSYTLRLLISIIRKIGLLDKSLFANNSELENVINELFAIYQEEQDPALNRNFAKFAGKFHPTTGLIHFAGLFDSVPGPIAAEERIHKDARMSDEVTNLVHFMAIDEKRAEFTVELIVNDGCPNFVQLWRPGSHGDVGGSHTTTERGLANDALHEMIKRANAAGLKLDPRSIAEYVPDPLAILHNSSEEYLVPGVLKWSQVTTNARRRVLTTAGAQEGLDPSVADRYLQTVSSDIGGSTLYMPSTLNHALTTMYTAATASGLRKRKRDEDVYERLMEKYQSLPPADVWSDAEDEDDKPPVVPATVPKRARL